MDEKIIWSIVFVMIVIIFCIIKLYTRRIFLFRFSVLIVPAIFSGCSSGIQSPKQEEKLAKSDY